MDNPHTYVTRFYGMYRLKMKHIGQKIHFVVMQSVFEPDKEIHETYDLKGSMAGRFVKEKELEKGEQNVVFKDVDLINRGRVLKLGKQKKQFLRQLDVDTKVRGPRADDTHAASAIPHTALTHVYARYHSSSTT